MKKYSIVIAASVMMLAAACGSTTNTEPENKHLDNAADSAVGNSDAANNIYRDSSNIDNATQSGGGTANPASNDSTPK